MQHVSAVVQSVSQHAKEFSAVSIAFFNCRSLRKHVDSSEHTLLTPTCHFPFNSIPHWHHPQPHTTPSQASSVWVQDEHARIHSLLRGSFGILCCCST